jgi:hypothetical protein
MSIKCRKGGRGVPYALKGLTYTERHLNRALYKQFYSNFDLKKKVSKTQHNYLGRDFNKKYKFIVMKPIRKKRFKRKRI